MMLTTKTNPVTAYTYQPDGHLDSRWRRRIRRQRLACASFIPSDKFQDVFRYYIPLNTVIKWFMTKCLVHNYLVMSIVTCFDRPECICGVSDCKNMWIDSRCFVRAARRRGCDLQSSVNSEIPFTRAICNDRVGENVAKQFGIWLLTCAQQLEGKINNRPFICSGA